MAQLLKGAPVAAAITENLITRAQALREQGVEPKLAMLRIGERADDVAYEHAAERRCESVGIATERTVLPADCAEADVIRELERINADDTIHGCLMFRPLPKHLDERKICEALSPLKDVDGMTFSSLTTVFTRSGDGFAPCTAQSVVELLDHYGVEIEGMRTAVIGRSLVIGRPAAMMLLARNATLTMCHTRTRDLPAVCREAEIVNQNQTVIDVGINAAPGGGVCGDVLFDEVEPLVRAISPVPSGVGAVTTAVLCKHVIEAAEKRLAKVGN